MQQYVSWHDFVLQKIKRRLISFDASAVECPPFLHHELHTNATNESSLTGLLLCSYVVVGIDRE